MNDDHSHRELLLKGALCGGLILVGFLSGGTLPTLAVAGGIAAGSLGGIGGNLAASLIENALHHWRAQWLSPAGARSADIAAALCQAFERAVQQIAQEWRNDERYLRLNNSPDSEIRFQASQTLQTLTSLRRNSRRLLQPERLPALLDGTTAIGSISQSASHDTSTTAAAQLLLPALKAYLFDHPESFVDYMEERLVDLWQQHFDAILRDPGDLGTRAWRSYQLLWQQAITTAFLHSQEPAEQIALMLTTLRDAAQALQIEGNATTLQLASIFAVQEGILVALQELEHRREVHLTRIEGKIDRISITVQQISAQTRQQPIPTPKIALDEPHPSHYPGSVTTSGTASLLPSTPVWGSSAPTTPLTNVLSNPPTAVDTAAVMQQWLTHPQQQYTQVGAIPTLPLEDQPPPPPVPFVGRSDLLQTLSRVDALPRLVIILGMPGVGKTALLRQLAGSFDGTRVFWYEFRQGLSSIGDILLRLTRFLDHQLNAGTFFVRSVQALHEQAQVDYIIRILNEVPCYLCFDSAHQIAADAAIMSFFEQLKEHLKQSTVFVTSRSTPAFYRASDPDRGKIRVVVLNAFSDDEVHAFCFQYNIVITKAIQEAIEQFGGLPLAMELLASLLHESMQEAEILQLISRVRQRTIDELFDAVYQSLDADARELLITASLFSLPFTQDQLIAAHSKIVEVSEARACFTALQRRMLIHERSTDFFTVHEAIRILAAAYVDDITVRRIQLAEALVDKPEREMMAHLEAILLLSKAREYDQAAELAVPLIDECLIPEYPEIAASLLTALNQDRVSRGWWPWLVGCQGHLAAFRGRFEEAAELFRTMQHLAEQIDDKNGMAIAHLRLGNLYLDLDHTIAAQHYDASLSLRTALEDTEAQALVFNNIGLLYIKQRRFEEAETAFQRGLALLDVAGAPDWRRLSIVGNLGYLYSELEQWEQARQFTQQAYALAETIDSPHDRALTLYNMGVEERGQGNRDAARAFYHQALDLAQHYEFLDVKVLVWVAEGRLHEAAGAYDEAITCFERVAAIHEQTGNNTRLAAIKFDIGTFQRYKGAPDVAIDDYVRGIALLDHLAYDDEQVTLFLANVRGLAKEVADPRPLVTALIGLKNRLRVQQPTSTYALARVYGTIGKIFIDVLDRGRVGLACLRRETQLLSESNRPQELIEAVSNLGVAHEQYHNFGLALDTMTSALELLEAHPDPYLSAVNRYNRGNSFTKLELWEQAEADYQQALAEADAIENIQLSNAVRHNRLYLD